MRVGKYNTDTDVIVIAEIGNNHEGDPDLCEKNDLLCGRCWSSCCKVADLKS